MLIRRERAINAVAVTLDIAFHAGRLATVSAAEVAERTGLARRGIEPLLQALCRAGLLESTRGPRGGYRLARPRPRINLLEIVDAVAGEEQAPDELGQGDVGSGTLQDAVVTPLWSELNEGVRRALAEVTLAELIRRAEQRGLARAAEDPISYSI